ncbi:MAG: hypothetical protein KBG38_07450, partial [Candidatus Cloacimonas sp.]|nr:hypothetical protein [Candidatus Cloacimonas sp.]
MKATLNDITARILACKKPYQELIQRLETMEIKQDMPDAAFFQELQKICLQSEEFAKFLEDDPQLKTIPLEHLSSWHNEYYASLANYDNCSGNPDYAVKQYGAEMGRFISALYYQFILMNANQATNNYLQLEENLRLYFTFYDKAINGNTDYADWVKDYRIIMTENHKTKLYRKFYQ